MQDVFIVAAVRTAVGGFGGTLRDVPPAQLGSIVTAEVVRRSGVDPGAVGHVVFGQVVPTEPRDAYLARVVGIEAGLGHDTPALTVNRLCGSGLQAILSAAQMLALGDAELAVAGGAESMSRTPFQSPATRWGARFGDTALTDVLHGVLSDPFHRILMGVTAENVAERYRISRETQDAYALESHRRAERAWDEDRFKDQIVPVPVRQKRQSVAFERDEHIRRGATAEDFSKLSAVFKEGGSVTAGNASGMNDGAAAVMLATADAVRRHGLVPMARLVAYAFAGVDPAYMGMGPVPATAAAMTRAGLRVADMDVIEANEAFAAQACAVAQELGFDPERVNPNGSGISIGHPVGATGAINTVKLVHELRRTGGRYGLSTLCIGGGQGIAAIVERL
ncbi:beta-ketothiolase BktB [Azospirillum sp. RWY-5-1]|uniref:Beta-ketothiolase BktB n=1 Tax=Azospirillum oleiclasticum TaxID=2735135 RepID=A0ABX2TAJ7_9PROT|nr:beta-ketothiolase BktB [Azospirillum oleiclasticum]NYZ13785.1 beta-ketothiolase BktB [Azospirillum oleiclasticum]NYZ21057.1 beta-ketothiolase BktB [Azospirillum oleiclasticum]